uniref:Uncharacterized protein n=1 Tax=uncultured Thiotrichaceae bacterium TaxID=298394 RepID=A0A6S6U7E1_9GAMM|nr:MAG: Unknown protein [uncultured Thiotrichaceae bacterium]
MTREFSIEELNGCDDQALIALDWKNLKCLNGRLLELHAEGALGNEEFAKLPRKPILCIDQIERIDDEAIEASFTFPEAADWAYETDESLEMLFQDQLDQLVGFWGSRKANGIGRALSSGLCELKQSLNFEAGKSIGFQLEKRKWVENKTTGTGTAIFNGRILDADGEVILETQKIIVGILVPAEVHALRSQHGGEQGASGDPTVKQSGLRIPLYDVATKQSESTTDGVIDVISATQQIAPDLWPFLFHFKGDPVVPGNFGTHGMIALLKETAGEVFGLSNPLFKSMSVKKFSGMIFEDPKQIRFELKNVAKNEAGAVVAAQASLYLENLDGSLMIETPIYTFKNLTVA